MTQSILHASKTFCPLNHCRRLQASSDYELGPEGELHDVGLPCQCGLVLPTVVDLFEHQLSGNCRATFTRKKPDGKSGCNERVDYVCKCGKCCGNYDNFGKHKKAAECKYTQRKFGKLLITDFFKLTCKVGRLKY